MVETREIARKHEKSQYLRCCKTPERITYCGQFPNQTEKLPDPNSALAHRDFTGYHPRLITPKFSRKLRAKERGCRSLAMSLAGVSGWPRLFHSMRASRQTELQREFPLHVVCSWLGNSPRIAQQSYLLVTEDDFARAAGAKKVMVRVISQN